jgi:DNA-binding beta-propeller fold protein YncE
MSPDGMLLFAANTPDGRLEVFRITRDGLSHRASIPVGLEPVAVAARTNSEIWVVNHLSDSVSIVELSRGSRAGRVIRTLHVGDEPRDIVFAGPGRSRAFITTAHRGQNAPFDPQLTTPGIGRADVWVFDANNLGGTLGGTPLNIISLFTDTPRALAVSPDGSKVYAAGFHTGNRTTTVFSVNVGDGGGSPPPATNFEGFVAPAVGLIVKHDGSHWLDELGRIWDSSVKFSLPDKDVFTIDAMASPPSPVQTTGGFFTGVGTILFNMAVNPVSGKVYVSNLESRNEVRFEGPGITADTTLRGHIAESRITVLDPSSGSVTPRHLNKHIDYNTCCGPVANTENATSLAFPQSMAVSSNGATLYVSALGSSEVGIYSTSELEAGTFVPSTANQVPLTGGGPTGVVLDELSGRLYVLTRFDNGVSVVSTQSKAEVAHYSMHSPEPASVVTGRRFLYDASLSSTHGDSACASCHIFGDLDSLAWDLGDPDGSVLNNPGPFVGPTVIDPDLHPMKGPMVTQSLRGMENHGPMHWRGDRTGGNDVPSSAQPDTGAFDEHAAFMKFAGAFVGLLGRDAEIPTADMEAFANFALQITYPPNPIRNLNNSLTASQQAGEDFFFGPPSSIVSGVNCNGCHELDRNANPGSSAPGFFGTNGMSSFAFGAGINKIPHLRNLYQKVGMFGFPASFPINPGDHTFQGDQVRGFGFLHDGSVDTVFRFMQGIAFNEDDNAGPNYNPDGIPITPAGDLLRRQLEDYMLAFDSNMAPIVGQQVTLTATNSTIVGPRISLLIARAMLGECDLVAKSLGLHEEHGFLLISTGNFKPNRALGLPLTDAQLRVQALLDEREITYTCMPPGSGVRTALDRDEDGYFDGDEEDANSDPADPGSIPSLLKGKGH